MKYLKFKNYLLCLVVFILLFGSCKENKKTIDDIIFMTKGCYTDGDNIYTFKKISEDVLYFNSGFNKWYLKIDEGGYNLVGSNGIANCLIPIPKNENDPILWHDNFYKKTMDCKN